MVDTTRGKHHLHLRGQIDTHACFRVAVKGDSILIFSVGEFKLIFCRKGPKSEGGVLGV